MILNVFQGVRASLPHVNRGHMHSITCVCICTPRTDIRGESRAGGTMRPDGKRPPNNLDLERRKRSVLHCEVGSREKMHACAGGGRRGTYTHSSHSLIHRQFKQMKKTWRTAQPVPGQGDLSQVAVETANGGIWIHAIHNVRPEPRGALHSSSFTNRSIRNTEPWVLLG